MFNFDLSQQIERFLIKNPVTKEYDIIRHLQEHQQLPTDALRTPLGLFRSHFLIHNALYRLQQTGIIEQRYQLNITAIQIQLMPLPKEDLNSDNSISKIQALSQFYLDWGHLNQTTECDINRLLDQFWESYFNPAQKQSALATLQLEEPVDFNTIKKQYRRLVMTHHPDRGGNAEQLIEVHQAMKCLEQYY